MVVSDGSELPYKLDAGSNSGKRLSGKLNVRVEDIIDVLRIGREQIGVVGVSEWRKVENGGRREFESGGCGKDAE